MLNIFVILSKYKAILNLHDDHVLNSNTSSPVVSVALQDATCQVTQLTDLFSTH